MCYMNRLEFACLAYIHSGKCTYHMCTNEERLSMSREIYLRSTLVTREEEGEHLKCVLYEQSCGEMFLRFVYCTLQNS